MALHDQMHQAATPDERVSLSRYAALRGALAPNVGPERIAEMMNGVAPGTAATHSPNAQAAAPNSAPAPSAKSAKKQPSQAEDQEVGFAGDIKAVGGAFVDAFLDIFDSKPAGKVNASGPTLGGFAAQGRAPASGPQRIAQSFHPQADMQRRAAPSPFA